MLSLLLLVLPAGAVVCWIVPNRDHARRIALASGVFAFLATLAGLTAFDSSGETFQLVERAPWIPSLNINYAVGVDGLSVLLLPTTALLFIGAILASWTTVKKLPRLYYSLLLILEAATLGVFCALDMMLFFLFWELTLVPLYFLISLWGIGPNRRYAATQYLLVMLAGGVPLLFGFLLLAFHQPDAVAGLPGGLVFDLPLLLHTTLPRETQYAVFVLLLLGFGVKIPLIPSHTWLPLMAMESPAAIMALVTGMKLGAFGLIRFAVPLAPAAAQELHWLLAGLGTLGVLYGAVVAFAQTNLRRMLAYSSISHVGLVVLGIASLNLQGLQGAVLQLVNFTLAAGGMFLLIGALHDRTGSTDVLHLGGAARTVPLLASLFLLFGLTSLGMPGTSGFPAEFLILVSALHTHTGAGFAALFGMVLSAGYFLGAYRRAFFGPIVHGQIAEAPDLRPREAVVVLFLALIILAVGCYPAPALDLMQPAADAWLDRLK